MRWYDEDGGSIRAISHKESEILEMRTLSSTNLFFFLTDSFSYLLLPNIGSGIENPPVESSGWLANTRIDPSLAHSYNKINRSVRLSKNTFPSSLPGNIYPELLRERKKIAITRSNQILCQVKCSLLFLRMNLFSAWLARYLVVNRSRRVTLLFLISLFQWHVKRKWRKWRMMILVGIFSDEYSIFVDSKIVQG